MLYNWLPSNRFARLLRNLWSRSSAAAGLVHDNTVTISIINVVCLYTMILLRVFFVIISSVIANPVPVHRYSEDTIFDSSLDQGLSTFGPQYVDQSFEEVSSNIISPLLESDASKTQPLGFTTLDIVQNSPSPPKQSSDESYIKSEAQFYRNFRCGDEKSVCCPDGNPAFLGSISLEMCSMSIDPFLPFLYLRPGLYCVC